MKNSLILILLISLTVFTSYMINGIQFPELSAATINGETINLPQDNGKNSIIALAFSANSRTELESWMDPLSNVFARKTSDEESLNDPYNSDLFLIYMYSKETEYQEALAQFKISLKEELKPHVLLYSGNVSAYKKELGLSDQVYIYIIDPHGNIIHTVSGAYSEKKLQEIIKLVAQG